MTREKLQVSARSESTLQCPYCHSTFDEAPVFTCAQCQTKIHQECFEIHGSCPVFACQETAPPRPRQRREDDPELIRRRLNNSRGTLALVSFLFALANSIVIPAFASILGAGWESLPWYSQLTIVLFASWDGWSSWLVTLTLLILNRILGRFWPEYRETINDSFSSLFLVAIPFYIVLSLLTPLAENPHF